MLQNIAGEIGKNAYNPQLTKILNLDDAVSPKNNPGYGVLIKAKFGTKKAKDNLNPKARKADGARPVNAGQGEF